jgi:hypothetical protein
MEITCRSQNEAKELRETRGKIKRRRRLVDGYRRELKARHDESGLILIDMQWPESKFDNIIRPLDEQIKSIDQALDEWKKAREEAKATKKIRRRRGFDETTL